MINIFYSRLNENEVYFINRLLELSGHPNFTLYNLDEQNLPAKDDIANTNIFVIHENTKAKSIVQKKFESIYGDLPYIRIDRPNSFGADREKTKEIFDVFVDLTPIKTIDINNDMLSPSLEKWIKSIEEDMDESKYLNLVDTDHNMAIEIRPNNAKPVNMPSLTYAEFFMLYMANKIIKFNKIEISEIK